MGHLLFFNVSFGRLGRRDIYIYYGPSGVASLRFHRDHKRSEDAWTVKIVPFVIVRPDVAREISYFQSI